MSREIMQQALDALEYHTMQTRPISHTDKAIDALRQTLAQPEPQVCCGDYEKCMKACTPRGRWLANQQMTRLKQEKGQFVGGVPSVSQQREWVGLTVGEVIDIQNCNRGFWTNAAKIEQLLKDKNT